MQNLNFHKLRVFHSVARAGSFTRAAKELDLTQPGVSKHVTDLERALKTTLLARKRAGVELTDAGKVALGYAARIFALESEMQLELQDRAGLRSGRLSIGASATPGECILPLAISAFRNRYPGVDAELDISGSQSVIDRVLSGDLDIGMVGEPVDSGSEGLEAFEYARDRISLAASPTLAISRQRSLTLADVDGGAFVMRERGAAARDAAELAFQELGLNYRVSLEVNTNEAVKRAAIAGLGIGALSNLSFIPEAAAGYLKILNVEGWRCERPITALHMNLNEPSATTARRAFINMLKTEKPMPRTAR